MFKDQIEDIKSYGTCQVHTNRNHNKWKEDIENAKRKKKERSDILHEWSKVTKGKKVSAGSN